jgi:hypothetical protein
MFSGSNIRAASCYSEKLGVLEFGKVCRGSDLQLSLRTQNPNQENATLSAEKNQATTASICDFLTNQNVVR